MEQQSKTKKNNILCGSFYERKKKNSINIYQ